MTQRTVTIIKALASADMYAPLVDDLRTTGDRIEAEIEAGGPTSFRSIAQLHFLSFFVIPATGHGKPLLALEANFDDDEEDFLARLARALGSGN